MNPVMMLQEFAKLNESIRVYHFALLRWLGLKVRGGKGELRGKGKKGIEILWG